MRIAILVPLLFALGCYRIDANVAGLSASAADEEMPAAGPLAGMMVEASHTFSLQPSDSALVHDLVAAHVDSVRLVPRAGVDSLAFLQSLSLTLRGDGTTPDVPLVAADTMTVSADGSILLPVDVDVDPARLEAPMAIDSAIRYVAPADAWTLGIDAVLTVHGTLDVKP